MRPSVVSASKSGAWLPMLSTAISFARLGAEKMRPCRRQRLAIAWILAGENLDSAPADCGSTALHEKQANPMIFRIDRCIVDTTAFELRRDDEVVPVQPQVFDLLGSCCRTAIGW